MPDLLFLYPTEHDIYTVLGFTKKTEQIIQYWKKKKLISVTNNIYQLTEFGKFAYLMSKFKINFLELCFLIETYCCEKRMREICKDGFYVKYSFYDKVEDVIAYGTVSNTVSNLVKKGLIYRHHKASYSVIPEIFTELMNYQNIIDALHTWFIEVWKKKNELILQDPLIVQRQNEFSNIYKNILFR